MAVENWNDELSISEAEHKETLQDFVYGYWTTNPA